MCSFIHFPCSCILHHTVSEPGVRSSIPIWEPCKQFHCATSACPSPRLEFQFFSPTALFVFILQERFNFQIKLADSIHFFLGTGSTIDFVLPLLPFLTYTFIGAWNVLEASLHRQTSGKDPLNASAQLLYLGLLLKTEDQWIFQGTNLYRT